MQHVDDPQRAFQMYCQYCREASRDIGQEIHPILWRTFVKRWRRLGVATRDQLLATWRPGELSRLARVTWEKAQELIGLMRQGRFDHPKVKEIMELVKEFEEFEEDQEMPPEQL